MKKMRIICVKWLSQGHPYSIWLRQNLNVWGIWEPHNSFSKYTLSSAHCVSDADIQALESEQQIRLMVHVFKKFRPFYWLGVRWHRKSSKQMDTIGSYSDECQD